MDSAFWLSRWSSGQIGFHRADLHPDLVTHFDRWIGDHASGALVPLCGKSVDLPWLAARLPTVGVELAKDAVEQFHAEQGLKPEIEQAGALAAYRSEGLTVLQGDVFALTAAHLKGVDRVWDRAAMVALDPVRRQRYVTQLRTLLPAGARILLNVLTYDQQVMPGPPHSVSDEEVRAAYAGAQIELVDVDERLDDRWRERGHEWWQRRLYLITV